MCLWIWFDIKWPEILTSVLQTCHGIVPQPWNTCVELYVHPDLKLGWVLIVFVQSQASKAGLSRCMVCWLLMEALESCTPLVWRFIFSSSLRITTEHEWTWTQLDSFKSETVVKVLRQFQVFRIFEVINCGWCFITFHVRPVGSWTTEGWYLITFTHMLHIGR